MPRPHREIVGTHKPRRVENRVDTLVIGYTRVQTMTKSEFISIEELSALTGFAPSTIRNAHLAKRGPLAGILCKLGNRRLGCWRADYELWRTSQRRLKDPATEQRPAA
jgi:hypothetical protein